MIHLPEIVGAHQPDKAGRGKASPQHGDRIGRKARPEARLDVAHLDLAAACRGCGPGQTLAKGSHAARRLQRILRRDEPPDFVEIEALQRFAAEMEVAAMSRVEGAAEEPDPPPVAAGEARRQAEKGRAGGVLGRRFSCGPVAQGRTWPLPRTRYL